MSKSTPAEVVEKIQQAYDRLLKNKAIKKELVFKSAAKQEVMGH